MVRFHTSSVTHLQRVVRESRVVLLNERLGIIIILLKKAIITRMCCEYQTFANFAMVDQFITIKSAKPKLLLVFTHDPAIVRSQSVKFSADSARS